MAMSLQENLHGWLQDAYDRLEERLMPTIPLTAWKPGDLDPPWFNMHTGEFYGDIYQEYCEKNGEDWRTSPMSFAIKARYSNYETWALAQLVICLTRDHRLNQYEAAFKATGTRDGVVERLAFFLQSEFASLEWLPEVKGSWRICSIKACTVEDIHFDEIAGAIADLHEFEARREEGMASGDS